MPPHCTHAQSGRSDRSRWPSDPVESTQKSWHRHTAQSKGACQATNASVTPVPMTTTSALSGSEAIIKDRHVIDVQAFIRARVRKRLWTSWQHGSGKLANACNFACRVLQQVRDEMCTRLRCTAREAAQNACRMARTAPRDCGSLLETCALKATSSPRPPGRGTAVIWILRQ